MKPPCKDCPDRVLGCHKTCEKYLAYREELDAVREQKIAENDSNYYNRQTRYRMAHHSFSSPRRYWRKDRGD